MSQECHRSCFPQSKHWTFIWLHLLRQIGCGCRGAGTVAAVRTRSLEELVSIWDLSSATRFDGQPRKTRSGNGSFSRTSGCGCIDAIGCKSGNMVGEKKSKADGAASSVKLRRFHKHIVDALSLSSLACKVGDTLIWYKKTTNKCTTGPKRCNCSILLRHISLQLQLQVCLWIYKMIPHFTASAKSSQKLGCTLSIAAGIPTDPL